MLTEHASAGIVETLSPIELEKNGPARTADEQAESLRAALAVHVEILRDLMEDRDAALRKGRAIAKALAARDAARDATLDAMLRVLDGRKARWLLRRVLAGWHSHVEKATMLRNMRALSASSLSSAASSEAREAAAAPLVDALFSHRPSTLLDTSQLRDSLLGPIRASSSTSVGSAPNQTNGPAAVPPEIAPPSPRASTAFTSDPATPSSPVTPADASGGWRQREEGLLKRLQHLSVENAFLRERVDHLETSVRSLTGELVDKKELLHHVYVLHHRSQGLGGEPPADGLTAWALPGLGLFLGQDARRREREVADAMEGVLDETLRANMQLQQSVAVLRKQVEQLGHTPRTDAGSSQHRGLALQRF